MVSDLRSKQLLSVLALVLAGTLSAQSRGGGTSTAEQRAQPPSRQEMPSSPAPSQPAPRGASNTGNTPREAPGAGHTQGNHPAGPRHLTGPRSGDRPAPLPPPPTQEIQTPRPLPQATVQPEARFWAKRDLFQEMKLMARRGPIPVIPVADTTTEIKDYTQVPSGWKAYGFLVPGKENLHVRLRHPRESWFRVVGVNKWGQVGAGLQRNLMPTGKAEMTFQNVSAKAQAVYMIVDDPGWVSDQKTPYTLTITRSWDPAKLAVPPTPRVEGIWAEAKAETTPAEKGKS